MAFAGAKPAGFNDDQITWLDLDTGLETAQASGKPIFLLVHAAWCGVCREYKQVFFHPKIVSLSEQFVFVLVDQDAEPAASESYAPDGAYIPRSMVLTPEGVLRDRIDSGYDEYRYFLDPSSHRQLSKVLRSALQ